MPIPTSTHSFAFDMNGKIIEKIQLHRRLSPVIHGASSLHRGAMAVMP